MVSDREVQDMGALSDQLVVAKQTMTAMPMRAAMRWCAVRRIRISGASF